MQSLTQRQCFGGVLLVVGLFICAVFLHKGVPRTTSSVNGRGFPQESVLDNLNTRMQEQARQIKLQQRQLDEQQDTLKKLKKAYKSKPGGQGGGQQPKTSDRISIYEPADVSAAVPGMTKASLRVGKQHTPMYVYTREDAISNKIISFQRWEDGQMTSTEKLLQADKDLQFIDFGCNLGVYTLLAAKMGRKVVAVDANEENLKRLRRSIVDARFEKQTTLLLNAIHKDHHSYKLRHHPTNIGGDSIYEVAEGTSGAVKSVTMDEILAVTPFRKALLKLDIEGTEFVALHAADRFFREMTIPVIFMEWGVINRDNKDGKQQAWILKFFDERGFAPFEVAESASPLSNDHFKWPWDIVWKKKP